MANNLNKGEVAEMLANKFYQSISSSTSGAWNERTLHLRKTFEEYKTKILPVIPQSRLDGPSAFWKIFRRLNQAICFAGGFTKDCMVFAFEERIPGNSGQRLFLVTHAQHMWPNHKSRHPKERCTYEVITEGAPCKLYFDLEFDKTFNECNDGNNMTKIFTQCVIAFLFEEFSLKFSTEDFLWLDASTHFKYSCHLILQMGSVAFENNYQTGSFVSKLLATLKRKVEENATYCGDFWPYLEELKSLFILTADKKSDIYCDDGVYTKNRNFRTFLSTKYGKMAPLLVSENNLYIPTMGDKYVDIEEVIFYDSLVTYFRNVSNFSKLLALETYSVVSNGSTHTAISNTKKILSSGTSQKHSPFPEVDCFILSIVKDETAAGFIRKWIYLEKEELIVFEIGGYRFCNNIERHHKSNNIMLVVDMKQKIYYQKCHDPECRKQGYKSNAEVLPPHIISLYEVPDNFFDANVFSQNTDSKNPTKDHQSSSVVKSENDARGMCDDLSMDSYAQLCNSIWEEFTSKEASSNTPRICNDSASLEESFLEESSLDDLCLEHLKSQCVYCTEKKSNDSINPANTSDNCGLEDLAASTASCSNLDDISFEEEIMMSEAAAAVEITLEGAMFSEETLF